MPKCRLCGAETILYVDGLPICVACDDAENNPSPEVTPRPPVTGPNSGQGESNNHA